MGMYDTIIVPPELERCPECGDPHGCQNFQSKDGECNLEHIPYTDVDRFYTSCRLCGEWVEYARPPRDPATSIKDYVLATEPTQDGFFNPQEESAMAIKTTTVEQEVCDKCDQPIPTDRRRADVRVAMVTFVTVDGLEHEVELAPVGVYHNHCLRILLATNMGNVRGR